MKKIVLALLFLLLFFSDGYSQSWYSLGTGLIGSNQYDRVNTLCNDSVHNRLWAAGMFQIAGADSVNDLAWWDGMSWHPLLETNGSDTAKWGLNAEITCSIIFEGKYLFAQDKVPNLINRWRLYSYSSDSLKFSVIGTFNNEISCLAIYQDTLYVGGKFTNYKRASPPYHSATVIGIAKWNGSDFVPVGNGLGGGYIDAMCVHNNKLVVGGFFEYMNGVYCKNIAQWDGGLWSAIGAGIGTMGNFSDYIKSLASYHGKLYAGGGDITIGGGTELVVWNGFWAGVGSNFARVTALFVANGILYIGADDCLDLNAPWYCVAQFNDTTWHATGKGPIYNSLGTIMSFAKWNDSLYCGGKFIYIDDTPYVYAGFAARFDPTLLPITNNVNIGICNGDIYNFNGMMLDSAGEYTDTLTAISGADSIVILSLAVNQPTFLSLTQSICEGDSYNFNGHILNLAGTYLDTLNNVNTCDSVITLVLNVTSINAAISISNDTLSASGNGIMQWIDCSTNQPISGATDITFIAITAGNYAAIITNGSCSDTTQCVNFTGVNGELTNENGLQIYPNPTSETVIVIAENIKEIVVSNLLGLQMMRLLRTDYSSRNDITIDISKLPQGIYLLRVETNDGYRVGKVVKE